MTPTDLRAARLRLHLTQAALAAELGVHEHTVRQWEKGRQAVPAMAARLVGLLAPGTAMTHPHGPRGQIQHREG